MRRDSQSTDDGMGESVPEGALRRANRALKTLSDCNLALSRAGDEQGLLHAICRIAVETGGYRLAWVGYAEQDEARRVLPVAQAGSADGYLETAEITWDDTRQGRGPTGTAIRTGKPALARDTLADPHYAPWRAEATRRGHASSIALPLVTDDRPFGALNIYAGEADAFDAGEVQLLTELADNLAYGIAAFRTRAQRQQVESALRRHSNRLQLLNRAAQLLSSTLDLDEVLGSLLQETSRLTGATSASVWLVDRETGDLVCRQATYPEREVLCGWRLPQGQGLAGWVVRGGRPVNVPDTRLDDRHHEGIDRRTGVEIRSLLTMPLKVKGRVIGALQLADQHVGRFHAEDLILLEPLAGTAAAAIENARVHQEVDSLRQFNENIVCGMDEGILLEDEEGRIIFTNPKTSELLGYAPEELHGLAARDIVAPDQWPRAEAETAKRPLGVASRYEIVLQTKEGQHLPVLVSARPILKRGQFEGVLSVFTDITERRQAEQALQDRNRELAALNTIAANINEALNLDDLLSLVLETVLELLDLERGWIHLVIKVAGNGRLVLKSHRGLPPQFIQSLELVEVGACTMGHVVQTGEPMTWTSDHQDLVRGCGAKGLGEGMACACVPLKSKNTVLGVLGVAASLPRQLAPQEVELLTAIGYHVGVAAENLQLSREQADMQLVRELNRLRSELVANVSHELKTPLGLIKVFASTLLREDVEFDRRTRRELLANIEDEADKLESIVDNLLDLGRLDGGALRLDFQEVDIGQLAGRVTEAMAPYCPQCTFVQDFPSEPLLATVDGRRIEQVFRNLLDNAVKYSPEGGPIIVQGRGYEGEIFVQVRDQGIGIPPEELERVFERFYRVDNEGTRGARGVGLGLAVCRGIVETHGGQIWAESIPDQGSTFTFTLPVLPLQDGTDKAWVELL